MPAGEPRFVVVEAPAPRAPAGGGAGEAAAAAEPRREARLRNAPPPGLLAAPGAAVDEYPMPPLAPLCACCKIFRNHLQIAYGQLQEVRRLRALDLERRAAGPQD